MSNMRPLHVSAVVFSTFVSTALASAEVLTIDASAKPPESSAIKYHLGASRSPRGGEITVSPVSLLRDGKPWLPAMGEFQYSRYPAGEWRDELLKMKAGGMDIVATYVFWIHHEEVEGQWDWTGQRDLRKFLETCKDVGLPVILRIGPWDHGEVRSGGFPDWLIAKGLKLRGDDPAYIAEVKPLYQQIAEQARGMLWKDGGPVIGVQVENEYRGRGEHLMHLKQLAIDAGLDTPIYTRTGWPNLSTPVPFGEILPLFGAYAEGFWDRDLKSMPGQYWRAFEFQKQRTDNAVATDQLGARQSKDERDAHQYPYLTCELGGGMMSSYHRRIKINPMDVLSVAVCKIGSGSNLPGYYVYQGGTNPDSKTGITLQEAQATKSTNYNDMPVKNYDFQAPLGACGQVRESYHLLRRLHLFLQDFGPQLAGMSPVSPTTMPSDNKDNQTLRWCVRSDGGSGYLFVNNYQRGLAMPAKTDVQFKIKQAGGEIILPERPMTVPADSCFIWPMNLDLGGGATLSYATAQLVCQTRIDGTRYMIFSQTPGVPADFAFAAGTTLVKGSAATAETGNGGALLRNANPGTTPLCQVAGQEGKGAVIVLLDDATSLQLWKGPFGGKEEVLLSAAGVVFDHDQTRLIASRAGAQPVKILRHQPGLNADPFEPLKVPDIALESPDVSLEVVHPAGPMRTIKMGSQKVAEAPVEADFDGAATYRVKLPKLNAAHQQYLQIHYAGDVARLYLDGQLLADDFYNGDALEIRLDRYPGIDQKELLLKILPLQMDAPIAVPQSARSKIGTPPTASIREECEIPLRQ